MGEKFYFITEPPHVAPFLIPEAMVAGSRVAVQCLVVQGDPPISMEWFHGENKAIKTPGITVTPLGEFVLTLLINEVKPEHEGNYTCKASSVPTKSSSSHSALLRVHGNFLHSNKK